MERQFYTILHNDTVAAKTWRLELASDDPSFVAGGEFVQVAIDGFYLRRPVSVCDCRPGYLTLIYKAVGAGTEKLARMEEGEALELLTGLGNGYDLSVSGSEPLLIGGGAGVPPMYLLARKLTEQGKHVTAILGFNTADEVFYEEAFRELGACVIIATADGSRGVKGFVTNAMEGLACTYFYTCGPGPMLKAVYDRSETEGQFSFEERMGCGFGACVGCTCRTKYGSKRICRDGPVLTKEEIVW